MYNPKYLALIEQTENLEQSMLPVEIIRDIKGVNSLRNLTKNSDETDARYQTMVAKDEKVCRDIEAWLAEEVSEDNEVEGTSEGEAAAEGTQTEGNNVEGSEGGEGSEPAPSQPQQDPMEKIILENTQKGRIHERELTTILGRKPDKDFKVGNLRIKRVFLGDGAYSVK
jgi:hypothetical protein